MSNTERQRKCIDDKKAKGLVRVSFWLNPEDKSRIDAYSKERGMTTADSVMEMCSEAEKMNLLRVETIYRMGHY